MRFGIAEPIALPQPSWAGSKARTGSHGTEREPPGKLLNRRLLELRVDETDTSVTLRHRRPGWRRGVVAVEAVQGDAYAYQVLRGMSEEQQLLSSRGRRTASDRGIRGLDQAPEAADQAAIIL